jgi:HlyD family secretion protein
MRRVLLLLVLIAVALAAGGWWYFLRDPREAAMFQGYAEAEYVKVAPTQSGILMELAVKRGDTIEEGTFLFVQDAAPDKAAREEAFGKLAQAEALLANLEKGGRPSEIEAARAEVREATAGREKAAADLTRGESLFRDRVIARQRLDELMMSERQAAARLLNAEARLETIRSAARTDEIEAQRAAVAAARATLAQAEWRLQQRRVSAPAGGLVADTIFRPGEHVAAGQPVVSLLPPENLLVRFFVPETALARLKRGSMVRVDCDSCPPGLLATVSFIAPQPEFTPPVIYSQETRQKLVFMVEARPVDGAGARALKPGQPVDVRLAP